MVAVKNKTNNGQMIVSLSYTACLRMITRQEARYLAYRSCKICLKRLKKRHTQSKLHAVLEPFGLYAWFWSLLKGDTLRFVSQPSESL